MATFLKAMLASRIVGMTLAACLGAAVPTVLLGNPETLSSERAASWFSALATFAATLVALGLGLLSLFDNHRKEQERIHGAALVFLSPVQAVLATLESLASDMPAVQAKASVAAHYAQQVQAAPALLPPERLPFVAALPPDVARQLAIAASGLEVMKANVRLGVGGGTPAALQKAERHLTKAFLPLGNMLQTIVFEDQPGPWAQRS